MQAVIVPLKPVSLNDWEQTDIAWWHLLAAARAAWQDGREGTLEARRAIEQATKHLRR